MYSIPSRAIRNKHRHPLDPNHGKKTSSAINVHSTAALIAIANRNTTRPLAVVIREKAIRLRNTTSITFHWVKGHAGLRGNKRADYMAKQQRVTSPPAPTMKSP